MPKTGTDVDLLLINAPGKQRIYQDLASEFAASEPPIWAGFIANFARRNGLGVEILDAEALGLSYEQTVESIRTCNPVLAVFVVHGQQPSASTQCMPAAGEVCRLLKVTAPDIKTLFMGTHPSALPEQTLREESVDFVCQGEGPFTILRTVEALKANSSDFAKVGGLWYWDDGQVAHNAMVENIENLDQHLPGMAWDLLPMHAYKAHNWHCWEHIEERQPYASLYTSLGCPFRCSFCCINTPFGKSGIRYFSPQHVIGEIDTLVQKYGVKNIKFADEMFVLNPSHVLEICDLIIERQYDLNIWAYSRIGTPKGPLVERRKGAGFNWLGFGIEYGSKYVRDGVEKRRFGDDDILKVVDNIRQYGINVAGNYIFGLPDDTFSSMQDTLDLALEINSEWANFYSAMAYPGSALHGTAKKNRLPLPEDQGGPGWIGYSQHAYECMPLPTDSLSAGEVLSFRDRAFDTYFKGDSYLRMMRDKFGEDVITHLQHMTSHQLERKYAEPI